MNKNYENIHGISIKEFKEIVNSWSETNTDEDSIFFGEPCMVWIENEYSQSNTLKFIGILNKKLDSRDNIYSDMLLRI